MNCHGQGTGKGGLMRFGRLHPPDNVHARLCKVFKVAAPALLILALFASLPLLGQETPAPEPAPVAEPEPNFDTGHTAWMLISCALVLFMTPGLALFYGGMVRTKNILGTIMHSMFAMGIISVVWVIIGYSIAFGDDMWGGLIGNPFQYLCLDGITWKTGDSYPKYVDVAFQMMFAIITPALITGAFAERIKFRGYALFIVLWSIFVYSPLVHWVWGGGILAYTDEATTTWIEGFTGQGALDFAGGNVVHLSSGISALIFVLMVGKRRGYPDRATPPNCLVWTMIGAGILWFGWFGFNGGSALASDGVAALAFLNTHICAAAAAITWSAVEKTHRGKASALGFASGVVAGLVCITPAAGFVEPASALVMGVIVGVLCYIFVTVLKGKLGYDDSLDAFGIHGVGGACGGLLTGIFVVEGLSWTGKTGATQLWTQFVSIVITAVFAAVATAILVKVVDVTVGLRVTEDEEQEGLDLTQHGEVGYNF